PSRRLYSRALPGALPFCGSAVSIDGGVLVVGARRYYYSGSAYVFRYDGSAWVEEQEIRVSPTNVRDRFGWSVAVSGAVLVAGGPDRKSTRLNSSHVKSS